MDTLVYISLALVTITAIGVFAFAPQNSLGYRPLMSGYAIVAIAMFVYIPVSASLPILVNNMTFMNAPQFSAPENILFSLFVNGLAMVLFVIGYLFFTRNRTGPFLAVSVRRPENLKVHAFVYAIVVAGLLMKLMYMQSAGGFSEMIIRRSGGLTEGMGLSTGVDRGANYLNELSFIADAAAVWLALSALRARKAIFPNLAILTITLVASFLISSKRDVLLPTIIALMTGFGIYVRPLKLSHAPMFVASAILFSALTLAGRVFLPAYAAGFQIFQVADSWTMIRNFLLGSLSMDLGLFESSTIAISDPGLVLSKFHGGWWEAFYRPNIEPFVYFIPRFAWPNKPEHLVDMAHAVGLVVHGGTIDETTWGFNTSLIGVSWVYGGFFGVAVGMAILAWCAAFVDRFLAKSHYASPTRILIFATSVTVLFQIYRQGTAGWVFLSFFQTQLPFFLTVLVLGYLDSRVNVGSKPGNAYLAAPQI